MKNTIITAVAALMLGFASTVANAATTTTSTFAVTTNVQSNCVISAAPLSFGNYTGAVNNATSSVTVTCTNTTPYDIGLNAGTATGATTSTRKMQNGSALLNYLLFSDSPMSKNWGNVIGTDAVHGTGVGAVQNLTVYGQIPASQYVTPGAYSDTITATLTY